MEHASSRGQGSEEPRKENAATSHGAEREDGVLSHSNGCPEGIAVDTATQLELLSIDSVTTTSRSSSKDSGFGGMSRGCMSMGSLSLAHDWQREIDPISEEGIGDTEIDCKSNCTESIENALSETSAPASEIGGRLSSAPAVPDSCFTTSNDRRPSRRSRRPGTPLRSSLKSSLKSASSEVLGDESLRSSIRSTDTTKSVVSFASLEIRAYRVTLGDQPTAHGPPVSLGWDYDASDTREYDVERYEAHRASAVPRRRPTELLLSAEDREGLLEEAGFGPGELRRAAEEAKGVLRQREKSRKAAKKKFVEPRVLWERTRRTFSLGKKTRSYSWEVKCR